MKYMSIDRSNFYEVFSDINSIARDAFEDYFDVNGNYLEITESELNQFIKEMNECFEIIKTRLLQGYENAEAAKEEAWNALEKIAERRGFPADELLEAMRDF